MLQTFTFKVHIAELVFFHFLLICNQAESSKVSKDKSCGTLYSKENFAGDSFILNDFDQSMNLRRDYRTSIFGWQNTGSIGVEDNCVLKICNATNLQGSCQLCQSGSYHGNQSHLSIQSAECICKTECNCQDTARLIPAKYCGKAYLGKGCSTCDSEYILLENQHDYHIFPFKHKDKVTSITIRDGCNLTLYSGWNKSGKSTIIRNTIQEFNGTFETYKCECNDYINFSSPQLPSEPFPSAGLNSVSNTINVLPDETKHLSEQRGNESTQFSQNVYILLIGAPNPNWIGLNGCNDVSGKIGECYISVSSRETGLAKAQIRIIYAPIHTAGFRWAATLNEYFANHTDLHHSIPDAVVSYHYDISDKTIAQKGSEFQRKLSALGLLRGRVLDEENTNLIFLLNKLEELSPSEQQNPEPRITDFEKVIENRTFPEPTIILTKMGHVDSRPKINGYWKMPNNEYWPKNLQEALVQISKKRNDSLGKAIFKAAFLEETDLKVVYQNEESLLPRNNNKVMLYREFAVNPDKAQNISALSNSRIKLNVSSDTLPSNKTNNKSELKPTQEIEELRTLLQAAQISSLQKENDLKEEIKLLRQSVVDNQNMLRNMTMSSFTNIKFNITQYLRKMENKFNAQIQDLNKKLAEEQRLRKEEERDRGSIRGIWERIKMCFRGYIYYY